VILVLGKRGWGKTTKVKSLLPETRRTIIIDTIGEYSGYGIKICSFEEFDNELTRLYYENNFFINIQAENEEFVYKIFEFIRDLKLRNLTIICDEIQKYYSDKKFDKNLDWIINYGRHYGLGVIATSRRPAAIKKDIIANTDKLIMFRVIEGNDLKYLRACIDKETTEKVKNLEKFSYIEVDI